MQVEELKQLIKLHDFCFFDYKKGINIEDCDHLYKEIKLLNYKDQEEIYNYIDLLNKQDRQKKYGKKGFCKNKTDLSGERIGLFDYNDLVLYRDPHDEQLYCFSKDDLFGLYNINPFNNKKLSQEFHDYLVEISTNTQPHRSKSLKTYIDDLPEIEDVKSEGNYYDMAKKLFKQFASYFKKKSPGKSQFNPYMLYEILEYLDYNDIIHLCESDKNIYNICKNDERIKEITEKASYVKNLDKLLKKLGDGYSFLKSKEEIHEINKQIVNNMYNDHDRNRTSNMIYDLYKNIFKDYNSSNHYDFLSSACFLALRVLESYLSKYNKEI